MRTLLHQIQGLLFADIAYLGDNATRYTNRVAGSAHGFRAAQMKELLDDSLAALG